MLENKVLRAKFWTKVHKQFAYKSAIIICQLAFYKVQRHLFLENKSTPFLVFSFHFHMHFNVYFEKFCYQNVLRSISL